MPPTQRLSGPGDSPVGHGSVPPPLSVAVSLTLLEVVLMVGYGVTLAFNGSSDRVALDVTIVAFFVLYGGALGWCAWQLRRLRSWARSPVVLAQLLQVLSFTSFWGGETRVVAVAGILVGLVVLAGVFHPDSIAALAAADEA